MELFSSFSYFSIAHSVSGRAQKSFLMTFWGSAVERVLICAIQIILILFLIWIYQLKTENIEWDYESSADWGLIYPFCAGTKQSPINIDNDVPADTSVTFHWEKNEDELEVEYINNGNTGFLVILNIVFILCDYPSICLYKICNWYNW